MNQKAEAFSNKQLKGMIVPLFFEQLLVMLVGLADTLVISYAGEAAVSGVSLVNQFNTIFIYLFTALASGGAVVISQYIGRNEKGAAGASASQLLLFSTVFSSIAAGLVLLGNEWILRLMFGKVEDSVMEACVTYLRISAYSYPALAVYNSGAAVCRSLGKNECNHVSVRGFQYCQRDWKSNRRICASCRSGGCRISFFHCPDVFGCDDYMAVLSQKK